MLYWCYICALKWDKKSDQVGVLAILREIELVEPLLGNETVLVTYLHTSLVLRSVI